MASDRQAAYAFGQFTLVPAEKRLLCDRDVVPLAPKVFDTLVLLVENQGRLIKKDELLKALWPNSVVEEQALAHNVSQLRKVLRDPAEDSQFIETVPKRGYRFIAPVLLLDEPDPFVASPAISGATPAARRRLRWSRPTVLAAFSAGLTLVAATAAYVYLSRAGPRVAAATPAIHSLAVLPLENLSGDKEQEYFADGMTDELITELGKIGALRVVSRTSTMQYKGTHKPMREIAGELQVDAVVEGTVLRAANRVRITAQLIEAASDRHLWSQSYERDLKDVLVLQADISRDIAEQVRIKLTPKQRILLTEARVVDPEAHDAYLRGHYWQSTSWSKFRSSERARKGLDYFRQAIARDPGYALAYAGVADSYITLGYDGGLPIQEAFPKAREAAMKALQLDPALAEAHTSLAGVYSYEWDWAGAEREFREALTLDPNYATAHFAYALYLGSMGRFDEAVTQLERARDLDPLSIPVTDNLGLELYYARRYDDALRQFRRGFEMYPEIGGWSWHMAQVYEQKKMFAEAFAQYYQSISLNEETQRAAALKQAYERSGYRGAVQQLIQFVRQGPNNVIVNPFQAHLYAMLDDEAHAMLALERAYDEHSPYLPLLMADPALDRLRGSPRFRDLVRRIGLPPSVDAVPVESLPSRATNRAR